MVFESFKHSTCSAEKLGINKTDPSALTEEEVSKFARLNIDPPPSRGKEYWIQMTDFYEK